MILADKIINLRKKEGMTQEDLANEIGVSRQSVSKWEASMSMPDLDKIMKLSRIFDVSTDFLLNDDLGMEQFVVEEVSETQAGHVFDLDSLNKYYSSFKKIAKYLAIAIPLFILSPIPAMLLDGINDNLGTILTIAIIAIAVGLCIYTGFEGNKYNFIEKEAYGFSYGVEGVIEKNIAEYEPIFKRNTIISIAIFILSPIIYIIEENRDTKTNTLTIIFLILIAIGMGLITYSSVKYSSNKDLLKYRNPKMQEADNKQSKASAILWVLAVGVYLVYSFITGNWYNSWIIFVIAIFIQAAISIFFDKQ